MKLNSLSPAIGSKKSSKRVGRGIGSGLGKTCGKGHKGQLARSGGKKRIGFEGGQMPLQHRISKYGFVSQKAFNHIQLRLSSLEKVPDVEINLDVLKDNNLIKSHISTVKIFLHGKITRAYKIKGISLSKGAKAAIEEKGGTIHVD